MFYQFILLTVMRGSTVWPQNESSQTLSVPLFSFHQTSIDLVVDLGQLRGVEGPIMMKNSPEWNIIVIQSAKQIDYLVDLKFYSVPSSWSNRLDFKSYSFKGFGNVRIYIITKIQHSNANYRYESVPDSCIRK